MASAMSDLFTVSFVAASLVLRISVRGRVHQSAPLSALRCDVGSANHCSASRFDLLINADIARPISSADDS
jgi:hypothetical protein